MSSLFCSIEIAYSSVVWYCLSFVHDWFIAGNLADFCFNIRVESDQVSLALFSFYFHNKIIVSCEYLGVMICFLIFK